MKSTSLCKGDKAKGARIGSMARPKPRSAEADKAPTLVSRLMLGSRSSTHARNGQFEAVRSAAVLR